MRRALAAALLAALAWASVPAGAGGDPSTGPFGSVEMHPHPPAGPEPTDLPVRVTFDDRSLLERAHRVLLSFNLHDPAAVTVDFRGISAPNGTVPLVKDERSRSAQPRVIVAGSDLANATSGNATGLEVDAAVETAANGRFHVGFMVIPFDEDWSNLQLDSGGSAELYGYSLLASEGHPAEGLEPPLKGSGNDVPGPGAGLALLAAGGAAVGSRRRSRRDGARGP